MGDSKTAKTFGIAGCYVVFFAVAFWLLFYHLDSHLLWGDEAETAVLAKNVVQFGVPRTFDGTNYIILHGAMDETPDHVWIWSPWLQEYFAASSFILLGPTTWAARAPFALTGWFSLVALVLVAYKVYRSHWIALASVALLGSSEAFLLHARQCRYYAVSVFAEIILIYGIHQLLEQKRRGVWLATAALILQFYSNYIIAAANIPALFALAWMLRKQGRKAAIRVVMIPGILIAAILPWLIYAHPWGQGKVVGGENYFLKAWAYLLAFHFQIFPVFFLLLPLLGLLRKEKQDVPREWERLLLFLLGLYFVTILFAPGFYLRYLLPLLPVACLLAAAWIFRHVKWRSLAALLIAILSLSNVLSMVTAYPFRGSHDFRLPLIEYGRGITGHYVDRFSDVLDFFQQESHPQEMVMSFDPEFPLRFYTGLAVIDSRLMMPPKGRLPDWILPSSASGIATQAVAIPEFLKPHYDKIIILVHDSIRSDSFPEPDFYQYQSVQTRAPFIIYKLKPDTNDHRLR
jgi:4-amino-4-deoxy-L-arabinose transferase-like glycosyltransferase